MTAKRFCQEPSPLWIGDSQATESSQGRNFGVLRNGRTRLRGGAVPRAASVSGDQARRAEPTWRAALSAWGRG